MLVDVTSRLPAGATVQPYATALTDQSGGFVVRFRLEETADGNELQVGGFELIVRSASVQVSVPFLVQTRRPLTRPGPGG